jgi:predicted transcriptional regulator
MIDPTLVGQIVSALKQDEPISISDLSALIGSQQSKLLTNVAVLAKMGFVSIEA